MGHADIRETEASKYVSLYSVKSALTGEKTFSTPYYLLNPCFNLCNHD